MINHATLRIVLADVALVLFLNSMLFLFLELSAPGLIVQTIDVTLLIISAMICGIVSIFLPPAEISLSRSQTIYVGLYVFVIFLLILRVVSLQVQGDLLGLVLGIIVLTVLLVIIFSYNDSRRRHQKT